ncbi:hypothetical protein C8Q80DRAFT_704100 [Daedaleopsis nitida]|nr:hypothetical protein C8Q80DRAFT_704100 [Daedaleopsis nitida]
MRLPMEVLEHIMDSGTQDPTLDLMVYPTLLAWSLTLRALVPRSRINLFKHVLIRTNRQAQSFETIIGAKPYLAAYVVEVTVTPLRPQVLSFALLLRALTGLKHVTFGLDWTRYPSWYASGAHMTCFKAVRRLKLVGNTFNNVADLIRLVRAFPELETLVMVDVKLNVEPPKSPGRVRPLC